jgi:putative transposase
MGLLRRVWCVLRLLLLPRSQLVLENLALRQQRAVLTRQRPRPNLRRRDRLFWVGLSWLYSGWRSSLVVVQPETVIRWHQQGFCLWWRWKSRAKRVGRPPLAKEIQVLIQRRSRDNPTWGSPRIQAELRLLGHEVAEATVAKYRPRYRKPPSQTWKRFLRNHAGALASMDFFVVPSVTFRLLYVFIIRSHARRRVVHFHVTTTPTAAWVSRQLREAFPFETAPRYLIRDRDGIYGAEVRRCLASLNIDEVVTASRSPWQSPYVERMIGSIRRELLDQVIVLSEVHLRQILSSYLNYYHQARPHMGLGHNAPEPRAVEAPERGRVVAEPMVGGLHQRYRRCA